jgi:hypothetical protein
VSPMRLSLFSRCHARLLNARISVPITSPFMCLRQRRLRRKRRVGMGNTSAWTHHDVRLKLAPMFYANTRDAFSAFLRHNREEQT